VTLSREQKLEIIRAGQRPPKPEYTERARPILEELHREGFHVHYISNLFNDGYEYSRIMPRLLEWIPRVDDPKVKEELIRAIIDKSMRPQAAPTLIDEYHKAPRGSELQWVIGYALQTVADDSVFDPVMAIVQRLEDGRDRASIIGALGTMKQPAHREIAIDTAMELLGADDPWIQAECLKLLVRRRATRALPRVQEGLQAVHGPFEKEMRKAFEKAITSLTKVRPTAT
jgi:hypothetical protein